jgi:diguanylate cyclase (GGDEF)-like protein
VRASYLGDQQDVERAGQLYSAWKPLRDGILNMGRRGDFDKARELVLSSGTPMYAEIDAELNKIIAFARNRAARFVQEARARRDNAQRIFYLIIFDGFVASFLCSAVVIRHLRRVAQSHEQALERMAHHDALTGLPNRQLFFDRFGQALLLAERDKRSAALLYVDLDRFKEINDTYGHETGDQLLVRVSAGFSSAMRRSDTVARLGGDEFMVLLKDLSENRQQASTQAQSIGEKILVALNQTYQLGEHAHDSTPSIGATLFKDQQESMEELIKQADLAMYKVKATGRNALRFFDPAMRVTDTDAPKD